MPNETPKASRLLRFCHTALDLVYPRHCLACAQWIPHSRREFVCDACSSRISFIGAERCRRCAMPLGPYAGPRDECAHCRGANLRFRRATAPCRYQGVARDLIHAFKYRNADYLAPLFADLMIADLSSTDFLGAADFVLAVPMYWSKRVKRGYNQAELLAERVAQHYKLPLGLGSLARVKDTPTQTALSRSQRQENLRDAFAVRRPERVKGKSILLCDDVMTTGATASECARVLLAAGAKVVYVSVAAR